MNFRDIQIENSSEIISKLIKEYTVNNDVKLKDLILIEFGKMREYFEKDGNEQIKEELWSNPVSLITNDIIKRYQNQIKALNSEGILVVDINYILPEYKGESSDNIKKLLEIEYGCKVFLTDSSRQNIGESTPVYFTKSE